MEKVAFRFCQHTTRLAEVARNCNNPTKLPNPKQAQVMWRAQKLLGPTPFKILRVVFWALNMVSDLPCKGSGVWALGFWGICVRSMVSNGAYSKTPLISTWLEHRFSFLRNYLHYQGRAAQSQSSFFGDYYWAGRSLDTTWPRNSAGRNVFVDHARFRKG